MMKNICKIASVSLLLLLASCIKSDYDTENCPGLYTITPIVPVELQQKKNEFLPNTNTSVMYPGGEWRKTEVGPENILELTKGQYRAVSLKGESEQVGLQGGVFVSVSSADGAAGEPGDFVGGYIDFGVDGGLVDWGVINYDLQTYIQTRLLTLKVKIEGDNSALVESVTATVDGITLSRELHNAFIENGERDRYPALSTGYAAYALDAKDADGYYTGSRRLLGLDANAGQNLVLTIHYKGGFQKDFNYEITADLDGFHTREVVTPWVISIVLRAGSDFTATIEDWKAGPEEWIDAKPF
jgi:hypothetical protein